MSGATLEAKKHALRQTQEGAWILTLNVHPNDMPPWLLTAPMGQRLGVVVAPLHDEQNQERPALPAEVATAGVHPAPDAVSPGGALPRGADGAAKPKKRWADMPIAQRAALVCSDPQSWPILGAMADLHEMPETDQQAAQALRRLCGVFSRAEIAAKPAAFAKYMKFETEYMRATGRIAAP